MKTRERFWVKCAVLKVKPIRQLMSELPLCRVTVCNKPYKFTGLDFLDLIYFDRVEVSVRLGGCCSLVSVRGAFMWSS